MRNIVLIFLIFLLLIIAIINLIMNINQLFSIILLISTHVLMIIVLSGDINKIKRPCYNEEMIRTNRRRNIGKR